MRFSKKSLRSLASGPFPGLLGAVWLCEEQMKTFSMPNFHFHATTAYDILRSKGVPLGKRDYMGRMKLAK